MTTLWQMLTLRGELDTAIGEAHDRIELLPEPLKAPAAAIYRATDELLIAVETRIANTRAEDWADLSGQVELLRIAFGTEPPMDYAQKLAETIAAAIPKLAMA